MRALLQFLFRRTAGALCEAVRQHISQSIRPDDRRPLRNAAADLTRSKSELILENAFLRQQLIVLQRQVKRPSLTWSDRTLFVLLASKLRSWKQALLIIQPDTLLRWHRDLFRRIWRHRSQRGARTGRTPLTHQDVALIKQMAHENRTWGAERIRGELLKLHIAVSKSTIQRYMHETRGPLTSQQTWTTFLHNHASQTWACDFLQTYDLLFRSVFVFLVIELGSRRVVHFAVTRHPTDAWTAQQLREATPFGQRPRFLLHDNDCKYGASFARVATGTGIQVLRTPYRAPKANATCERFLGSLRRECLDFYLVFGERHLHHTVKQYVRYFNLARPHQGIAQSIPCPPQSQPYRGPVVSHPILGGLHHDYRRQAA